MRILIASDDSVVVRILQIALRGQGYEVETASDGEGAWRSWHDHPAGVVISDWSMPGLTGLDLCRRIRDARSDAYTYFILVTASDRKDNLEIATEAGVDDYLSKPINLHELKLRLRVAGRIANMQDELRKRSRALETTNRRLFEAGRRDALTDVWNRRQMQEDLQTLWVHVERYRRPACLAICDVDRFKAYNDRQGHVAGDQVLIRITRVLDDSSRSTDSVYRYGGEEFVITLPEVELDQAIVVVDRLRQEVESLAVPHPGPDREGAVTISAGVSRLLLGVDTSQEDWIRRADTALYEAKQRGGNCVVAARANPPPAE